MPPQRGTAVAICYISLSISDKFKSATEEKMIEIIELTDGEARQAMAEMHFGHLACARNNHPYVVPIHFHFDGSAAYIYTTEGKKTEIIRVNPEVCLQAENVKENDDWVSVMIIGDAVRLIDESERSAALELILKSNPKLTPAISIRWMDSWVRENVEVIYRIEPRLITGRRTLKRETGSDPMLAKGRRSQLY